MYYKLFKYLTYTLVFQYFQLELKKDRTKNICLVRKQNKKMTNTRSINLRKSITNKWLRDYLYRFFRLKDKFNAEYIAVLTKLYTRDGYVPLGNKLHVNINNKHDILGYVNYVTDQF